MNVLFIPSWFPSEVKPMAGRFVLDQAKALRRYAPSVRVAIASWGHHRGALSLRDPIVSARALHWRLSQVQGEACWKTVEGVDCAFSPALSWSLGWRGGGVRGQLEACRDALQLALRRWGSLDLLHAHVSFPGGYIARWLGQEFDLPYVLTEHMSPFPFPALRGPDGRADGRLRPVFEDAAAVMAVSPSLAATIEAEGLVCQSVLPNVVDVDRFADIPEPVDRLDQPWVLLAIGGLTAQKGFDLLLRALAMWAPSVGQVELHIAGDGPERAALQALSRNLRLEDHVRWLGALDPAQIPRALAGANALVSASRHETFGVVLAEALAAGRPVLATRCGGPESVVTDEVGRLVAVEDIGALAQGMAWLREHCASFQAPRLRAYATERFGPAAVASQLLPIYERALRLRSAS